ncbi:hypothetical protein L211DRAFT_857412 [Terfezia boudieri ATCC MYA-4762]|uniref:Wax synthase domain-containing protein n=1 Tax=Terfezia boudieri ATCC MYA-4762 TaxID=1051890 RepID=A0A3N4LMP7_9PEZI|nr:hypothetical protein L211DRAFT_857412 [Terfezia boudieri ATCC MYA-4762]
MSIKHARKERRRQFHGDFRGFFILFWIKFRDTSSILRTSIFSSFTERLWELGLAMYRTHQVFFILHALTLLMKVRIFLLLWPPFRNSESLDANNTKKESQEDSEFREALAFELTSPNGNVTYPANLTLENYVDYFLCPTICYEMSYPCTEGIRWLIRLLLFTSKELILQTHTTNLTEAGLMMLESISLLLFPFMDTFLLVFLVTFEYVLAAFAEITCFFSREWNIPVHRFLERHVYGASRPYMSRPIATLVTFLISALAHELLRGNGFICQMLQLPIIVIQRSNMIWGLSMISTFYVLV